MLSNTLQQLNNPVWHALNQTHANFNMGNTIFKMYPTNVCPFAAIKENHVLKKITYKAVSEEPFYLVGEVAAIPQNVNIIKTLVCNQMLINNPVNLPITTTITKLTAAHQKELFTLVNTVQPGYFKEKTHLMGNYYGIIKNNQLIAVAGERIKLHDFTEVSAIVTHPNFTGKGYAKQLTAHVVNKIIAKGKTPFLHVLNTNSIAINLYEKLGFYTRKEISFNYVVKH